MIFSYEETYNKALKSKGVWHVLSQWRRRTANTKAAKIGSLLSQIVDSKGNPIGVISRGKDVLIQDGKVIKPGTPGKGYLLEGEGRLWEADACLRALLLFGKDKEMPAVPLING